MDEVAPVDTSAILPEDDTNVVSQLEEIVQEVAAVASHLKGPSWSYEELLHGDQLKFRATVSFTLDVPHHFLGVWQTSKKKAQTHTAKRVRHYLMCGLEGREDPVRSLPAVLGDCDLETCTQWKLETRSEGVEDRFRATVTLHIHGVPHHFCGSWCSGADVARHDTTDRVFWYFGQNQGAFHAPRTTTPERIRDQAIKFESQVTEDA